MCADVIRFGACATAFGGGAVAQNETATVTLEGNGTNTNPYKIRDYAQLVEFADIVNGTNGKTQNQNAWAVLTADITNEANGNLLNADGSLNDSGNEKQVWTPIGNNSSGYTGTFDGQGHTISGLYFKSSGTGILSAGLFGNISRNGTIKNVGIKDSYFFIEKLSAGLFLFLGGVCGANDGTIENCYNAGIVIGKGIVDVGGLCGYNEGTIKNCYNMGKVTGTGNDAYVGGVCGKQQNQNHGSIKNCYYLDGTADKGIGEGSGSVTKMSADDFKSGKVAWLLNGSTSDGTVDAPLAWHQNLDNNSYPALIKKDETSTSTVYATKKCGGIAYEWSNTAPMGDIPAIEHSYTNNTLANFPDEGTTNLYSYVCDNCKNITEESENKKAIKQLNSAGDADIIITKVDGSWKAADNTTVELKDDANANWYHAPIVFTVNSVKHTRAMSTDWATLCLPYAITVNDYKGKCKFYKLSGVDDEKITLKEVETVAYNTPVFVKRNDATVTSIDFTASNAKLRKTPTNTTITNNKLVGALNTVELTMDDNGSCLFIKDDKMWSVSQAGKTMTVKPFRAYIYISGSSASGAPQRSIAIDGEATAISDALDTLNDTNAEYYDMSGRRIGSLQKGVNIIRSGNKTRKVIIK